MPTLIHKVINAFKKTDLKYLYSGLSSVFTVQGVTLVVVTVTSYCFANYVDKGTFGNYQFALTMLSLMSIFTLHGVEKQIISSEVREGVSQLIPKTLQYIIYTLPVSAIGAGVATYFLIKGNDPLALAIFIIALTFPFIKGLRFYDSIYLARKKFKKKTILNITQVTIPSICLIIAILAQASLWQLVATYAISHVIVSLVLFIITIISEKIPLAYRYTNTSDEVHLSIGQSILEVGKMFDRLAIFSFLGAASLAVYMIAFLPIRELNRLPKALRILIMPKFARYTYSQVQNKVYEKTFMLFLLLSAIALVYISISPFIFKIMFPTYPEAIIYTQLLAAGMPFYSSIVITEMFVVFDRIKQLYIANITFVIVNIIMIVLGIFFFGIIGAIGGKMLAHVIRFFLLFVLSRRNQY